MGLYLHIDTDGDGIEDKFEPVAGETCSLDEDPPGTFIKTCSAELDHFSTYAMVAPLDSDGDGIPDQFGERESRTLNQTYRPAFQKVQG